MCIENFLSIPNIILKHKLKERFKVYNIDEYKTSHLKYKTVEPCNNISINKNLTNIDNWTFKNGSLLRDHLNDTINLVNTNVYYAISGYSNSKEHPTLVNEWDTQYVIYF